MQQVGAKRFVGTPTNTYINELVVEVARMSDLQDAVPVRIVYGDHPHVELKRK